MLLLLLLLPSQVTSNKTTPQPVLRVTQMWLNYTTGVGAVISLRLKPECASAQQLCVEGDGRCTLAVSSNPFRTALAPLVCCPVNTVAVSGAEGAPVSQPEVCVMPPPACCLLCEHTACWRCAGCACVS